MKLARISESSVRGYSSVRCITTRPSANALDTIMTLRIRPTHFTTRLTRGSIKASSLSKKCKPQRQGDQGGQARIGQDWKREHHSNPHQEPSDADREQQSQHQADEPSWKK